MAQTLSYLKESASQTAGPYVHIGLAPGAAGFTIFKQELGLDIAGPNAKGERIRIEGVCYDGNGAPVKDVLIETWQADANGVYAHPEDKRHKEVAKGFRGWGRVICDFDTGLFGFDTVKPGAVMGRNGKMQAPHMSLWIVARGINIGLQTRMYFGDEDKKNAADPVLNAIDVPARRETLVARREMRDGKPVYRFDIRLQGDNETVFFDV
ncbi:MAG: protocatechuate 3,4-dioxygenase subunit alpha [Beijerinckiaceae bacterium]